MRLLLDTHVFLWLATADAKLSAKANAAIIDAGNEKQISVTSLWEIAIKSNLGKLVLNESFGVLLARITEMPLLSRLRYRRRTFIEIARTSTASRRPVRPVACGAGTSRGDDPGQCRQYIGCLWSSPIVVIPIFDRAWSASSSVIGQT